MNAEVGGIKKNIETVLLAEFFLIKYIKIVKAPKETSKIWCDIAIINVVEKIIFGEVNKIIISRWNKNPPIAWYMLLDDNGRLLSAFFCQRVENVIANKLINAAITPNIGKDSPISKPNTKAAPVNPKIIPIHWDIFTFSFNNGPAKILVKTGWRVTISAVMPVGMPIDIE